MQWITIFRTFSAAEAQVIRSRLEASDFLATVTHEFASLNMDGYSMATGGILVQVPADQADDARALITGEEEGAE